MTLKNQYCILTYILVSLSAVRVIQMTHIYRHLNYNREFLCSEICECERYLYSSINCANKNLTALPEDIDPKVKILDLSSNSFTIVPKKLAKFYNLTHLYMADNNLPHVDDTILGLRALEELDLSYNNIIAWKKIRPSSMYLLDSLKVLILSQNALMINATSLEILNSTVEILKMDNCSFVYLPKYFFSKLPNVKEISLKYNIGLKSLHVTSNSLEILDVSYCSLEKINLYNFPKLKKAYLRGNRLTSIDPVTFKNSELKYLDISDNALKIIYVNAFSNLPLLENLNISVNIFNNLHYNTFAKNKELKSLIASRTYLQHMVPFNSSTLINLDLSVNEIQTFHEHSLVSMPSLQNLYLTRNLISRLPGGILSNSLRHLDLSVCQIIEIRNDSLIQLLNLWELNLSGNRLTSLKQSYFPKRLTTLHLDNNPWRCDCNSKDFRDFYIFLIDPPGIGVHNNLVCQSPEIVSGSSWVEACSREWHTLQINMSNNRILAYVLCSVGVIVVILSFYMYMRRMIRMKRIRVQEERERLRREAQERLHRIRISHQLSIEAQQNAPDPRELQRPPSYAEAIRMPLLNGSYSNLTTPSRSMPDLSKRNSSNKAQGNRRRGKKRVRRNREEGDNRERSRVFSSTPAELDRDPEEEPIQNITLPQESYV